MKAFIVGFVITVVLSLASLSVNAEDVNASANASTNSQSAANTNAQNANQQNIQFTSPHEQTIKSAPSLGGSSYGTSFSSDGCMNAAGGGVSFLGGAVTTGVPVSDETCRRIRLSYAWGQYAKYLTDTHRYEQEAKAVSMIAFELCQAEQSDIDACKEFGFLKQDQPKR